MPLKVNFVIDHSSGGDPPSVYGGSFQPERAQTFQITPQEPSPIREAPSYCIFDGLHWESRRGLGRFATQLRRHFVREDWRLLKYPRLPLKSTAGRVLLHEVVEPVWQEILNPEVSVYPHNVMPAVSMARRSIRVLVLHDVLFLQGGNDKSSGNRYRSAKLKHSIANADLILTVSEASRLAIAQMLTDEKEVLIIPNALAESFAEVSATPRRNGNEPVRILHFGGHARSKNTLTVFKAIALLRRTGVAAQLTLAAMAGSQDLVERWRQEAKLPPEAIIVLPSLSDDELKQAYVDARVHCMPSTGEGFGIPVIEAARCGIPNVLSPLAVFRELVGVDAIFTGSFDAEDIAQAIMKCLTSDVHDMVERARKRANEFLFDSVHTMYAVPALRAIEEIVVSRQDRRRNKGD